MVGSRIALDPSNPRRIPYAIAPDMERVLENLDGRLRGVEQLLPTLATKADLDRYATKDDLLRFATKADLESGLAQVRAFTEQVRDGVRTLAEAFESLSGRVDSLSTDVKGVVYTIDTLVTRLEAKHVI